MSNPSTQVALTTRTFDGKDHLLQILAPDGKVLVTIGDSGQSYGRQQFTVWTGDCEPTDGKEPDVFCRMVSAGAIAGGVDDPRTAWLAAVREGYRLAVHILLDPNGNGPNMFELKDN